MYTVEKYWENSFYVFWNNIINVKLNEISQPVKIYHIIDIEKLLGVEII